MAKRNTLSLSGGSKSANVPNASGIEGSRLAMVFLKEDEASVRSSIKVAESMKERLRKLCKLTVEEHTEFRATLEAKRDEFKAAMKTAGFEAQTKFFTEGGVEGAVANGLNATISLWQKLSNKVQANFKPDFKMGWNEISKAATNYKAEQAGGVVVEQSDTERRAEEVKAAAKVVEKAKAFANTTMLEGEGDNKRMTAAAASALPDAVFTMCLHASVEEIEAVIKRLQQMIAGKVAAREAAAKATAKASKSSKTPEAVEQPGLAAATGKDEARARAAKGNDNGRGNRGNTRRSTTTQ